MTFYFREEELNILQNFYQSKQKSMAIYGKRRTGKTELILHFIQGKDNCIYHQVSSDDHDYSSALRDFKNNLDLHFQDPLIASFMTFKDLFYFVSK